MTSMVTTVHFQTGMVSIGVLYKFQNMHENRSKHSQKNIALQKVHKHNMVSNEILIKLLFFHSHISFNISCSLLIIPSEKCQTIFLSRCLFKYKLHAYLFNLSTKNSAIAHDKYYILISDIEVREFSHNSILSVFQT